MRGKIKEMFRGAAKAVAKRAEDEPIGTGARKGKIYGYRKDGGRFRYIDGGWPQAFIDMVPRSGWDGRIRFIKVGDPPPPNEPSQPQRPGTGAAIGEGEDDTEDHSEAGV